ncbi:hypothetical protein BJY52DRAFT_1217102 [Lactarius psammicola]|nr:hypothetical protein BJY52DRAFT_1217102 [Lactarius psammicola]
MTMIPLSTPDPSASTPPTASTSPPGAVAVQHIAEFHTPLDILDVPALPSPIQVLDTMPPTGPLASLNPPMTGSDHTSSSPESHSSLPAPVSPSQILPQLSSEPDLGAVTEGEGSAKAASHKERDALDSPSGIRENIITAPDLPPQSPLPPSFTEVAIACPSWRSLGAEHTGDHPPHSSHGQYDIV